jgi:cobalt-zinc-cadmium efflux system protein
MGSTSRREVRMHRERRLRLALVLNLGIVVVQLAFGFAAHSVGLLADAGHNLVDVAAVLLMLVAVRLTARGRTAERSFGYHRSTVLAALVNAALVLSVTVGIAFEGVRRLVHPTSVHGATVLFVALIAVVGNVAAAIAVYDKEHELGMRSTFVHLGADAVASLGVAAAGAVILITGGWQRLDPAMALVIAVLIAVQGVRLLRAATDVLLESTPPGLDIDAVARAMAGVPGVEEVHDLHAWSLSSDVLALSAHVVMAGHPTLEEAQAVADQVKRAVAAPYGIAHATLELECETCAPDGIDPCAMEDLASGATHRH